MKGGAIVEIKLDRKQAFYAVIGSILLVSVVFVVGLLIGQRMQVPIAEAAVLANNEETEIVPPSPAPVEEPEQEADDFTFYNTLGRSQERPRAILLPREPVTAGAAGTEVESETVSPTPTAPEPAANIVHVARAARTPEPGPARHELVRQSELVRQPAPTPTAEAAPTTPAPRSTPDATPEVRPVRRTVVRVASNGSHGSRQPEEFGYFTVTAGRYGSYDEADAIRESLDGAGVDAIVTLVGSGTDRRFRVQTSEFNRRADADGAAREIRSLGLSAEVINE